MGDKALRGNKLTRVNFKDGLSAKVIQIDPLAKSLTEAGHSGGAGKNLKTKSDFKLKNQIKKIQKTPNKKFKDVNLTGPHNFGVKVKGSKGKKNYIQETKRYHQAHKKMGLIKD